jgi:hypothetical protein
MSQEEITARPPVEERGLDLEKSDGFPFAYCVMKDKRAEVIRG